MRGDVFDPVLEVELLSVRTLRYFVQRGRNRVRGATVTATGVGDQQKDAFGH